MAKIARRHRHQDPDEMSNTLGCIIDAHGRQDPLRKQNTDKKRLNQCNQVNKYVIDSLPRIGPPARLENPTAHENETNGQSNKKSQHHGDFVTKVLREYESGGPIRKGSDPAGQQESANPTKSLLHFLAITKNCLPNHRQANGSRK
jgi:hypothetical protein